MSVKNNMPSTPIVSVIIPVFNAEKFIAATLDSVKKQTYQNWECIIIDDGSTDSSKQVIDNFIKKDNRFHYLLGEHGGVSRARNMGIAAARGEFIALLDHDDLWAPTKLYKQVAILFQRPEVGLVYSDAFIQSSKKTILYSSETKPYRGKVFHRLVRRDFITCQTAIIRKKLLSERKAAFIPELEMAEEFELFLWIAARSEIDFVDEPLATHIVHGGNDSIKRYELVLPDFLLIYEKLKNDPVVQALPGSIKALSSFLCSIDREDVVLKWKSGQSVLKDIVRFARGCHLRTDWHYLLAMPFISYKRFQIIAAKLRQ
jgi:glycosyltransferase involved in cell wall biosynthesis